jgi:hypothetical protein
LDENGSGNMREVVDPQSADKSRFYRVTELPQ